VAVDFLVDRDRVRVFASTLQFINVLPAQSPTWYAAFQCALGAVKVLIVRR
jgi:hypothetical protein